jgi:radical SAM superfamily enzyme YgiQ (UPF0313 family)
MQDENCRKLRYLIVVPHYVGRTDYASSIPMGLAFVSSALKASGREVYSVDLNAAAQSPAFRHGDCRLSNPMETLRRSIEDNSIDVVLCGGLSIEYQLLKEVFDFVKCVKSDIVTIVGGGGITSNPQIAMRAFDNVDFGVVGEAEITLTELCYCIEHNDFSVIPDGVVCSKNDYAYVQREAISDLNILPFADYDILNLNEALINPVDDFRFGEPFLSRQLSVMMSRSCPFNCTFCWHSSGKYRRRSIDNIFAEIDILMTKHNFNVLNLSDDLFTYDMDFVKQFCDKIKGYGLNWIAMGRVDKITREILTIMKDAGLHRMFIGVESADNTILKSMRKGITVEQVSRAFQLCDELGIHCIGNIILGDIAETLDTINTSVSYCVSNPNYHLNVDWIRAYPDSFIYNSAVQRGIIKDEMQYLKDGCPQINITLLSDSQYWEQVDAYKYFKYEDGFPMLLTEPEIIRESDATVTLRGNCPHCGNEQRISGLSNMNYAPVAVCSECGRFFKSHLFPYIDWNLLQDNIRSVVSGHICGIWAANSPTTPLLLKKIPDLLKDNVYLINNAVGSSEFTTEIMGKSVFLPDVIQNKNIDAIICVNSKKVFEQIKSECRDKYPQVKRIVHLVELVTKPVV